MAKTFVVRVVARVVSTYIAQVTVREEEFQNPQELVTVWGEIDERIRELGGEIVSTYAVLGNYDFQIAFDVDDEETAFQVAQVLEARGLDTTTFHAIPLDRLGELVEDV